MNWETDEEVVTLMTSWFLAYAIGEKMESYPKIENSKEYQILRVGMRGRRKLYLPLVLEALHFEGF